MGSLITDGLRLLYFSSEIISKETIDIFNQNPINLIGTSSDEKHLKFSKHYKQPNYIYEFLHEINEGIWFFLLTKILEYRKKFTQMASELINKGAIGDINKLNKEYSNWSVANVNPLASFANYFNPILKKLMLEVDLINTEYAVPIKSVISGINFNPYCTLPQTILKNELYI